MKRKELRQSLSKSQIIIMCFFVMIFALPTQIHAKEPEPRLPQIYCTASSTYITSISKDKYELINYTGIYLNAGDSSSYSFGLSESVSNSAAFSLIPELLSYSYNRTYSVNKNWTVTVYNSTGRIAPVGRYRIYDLAYYNKATYIGNNTCSVSSGSQKVYKGHMLAAL